MAAQFPDWADLPIDPVDRQGWDNVTFRLGHEGKLRFPSAARYAGQPAKEHRWLGALAPHLPLPVPRPLGLGTPGEGYPYPWSAQSWLPGEPASAAPPEDGVRFAEDLAAFLAALRAAPAAGGPVAGAHSFHRGGRLSVYDAETRASLDAVALPKAARDAALGLWVEALDARWSGPAVWAHGDVAPGNLLIERGRLAGVIDFGTCAVGDPACDLVIAWTALEGPARARFRDAVAADAATWARARGWALWKALLLAAGSAPQAPGEAAPLVVVERLIAERRGEG